MSTSPEPTPPEPTPPEPPPLFDGPPDRETDPLAMLTGYLDWYRSAVLRKLAGLSEAQLVTPLDGTGWAPLAVVQHLGLMERRWFRWGFLAEALDAHPLGPEGEWRVTERPDVVLADYRRRTADTDRIVAAASFDQPAAAGGRFASADDAPTLGRILTHVLQEYARHAGHLDVARQLIDGATGE